MGKPPNHFFPLMCSTVPECFRSKAQRELSETDENTVRGLKRLREFLHDQGYPLNTDDIFLLQFLRQQKFNYEKAEEKLKQHYEMRERAYELYQSMDVELFSSMLDTKILGLLPYRDDEGRAIIFTYAKPYVPNAYKMNDLYKCALALFHFASTFPLTSICGINYVGSLEYLKPLDAIPFFTEGRKFIWIKNSSTFREQRLDFFNEFPLFRYLWFSIRPFLPSKFAQRVRFHGTDPVTNLYDPSIIPTDFGGSMGPLENDSYKEQFLAYVKKLKEESHLYRKQL